MKTEKGTKKRTGTYYFSISIHIVLLCLIAFPFFKSEQPDDLIYNGLLVQFTPNTTSKTIAKSLKNKTYKTQSKKAAETKVLKPKLNVSRKKKTVHKKKNSKKEKTISSSETSSHQNDLLEHNTLNEKRREYLVKQLQKSEEERQRQKEELSRSKLEEKAKKQKYEKMKSAFSHLLKNANNETTINSDFDLNDKSLSDKQFFSENRGSETLSNRQVLFIPQIKDTSQKQGRVVIQICVNAHGNVTTSKYTQKGSTTTDSYLIDLATKSARLYRFSESNSPRQCGIVNIDFELR